MALETSPHISTPRMFRLFFWLYWRTFKARLAKSRKDSPLLGFILGGFIIGYLLIGFFLFRGGLEYLRRFPLIGSQLTDRLPFLVFGFFFVMLVVSNIIIGYTTLFRNREAQWLLATPMRHKDVYRWKFTEALIVSSWALVFLSAPLVSAYGVVHHASWDFYAQIALCYVPFVIIPATVGSWLVLFLVRFLGRPWVKRAMIVACIAGVVGIFMAVKPVTEQEAAGAQEAVILPKLMRGTKPLMNPFLPSTWIAEAMKKSGVEGQLQQSTFYFLLLLSNALFGLLLTFQVGGRCYYGSWAASLSSRAEQAQREIEAKRQRNKRAGLLDWLEARCRPLSPKMVALVFKDARIFWREPAQWTQFMIFFGLLCIYVMNLRNVAFEYKNTYWGTLISYLNLAACALTLSTLTTRFVYPMFSLEGRRVWILGLSPVGLRRVAWQKFWTSFVVSAIITIGLMVTSSMILNLPTDRVVFFAFIIMLMSAALSGLAAGLGALFPNFKEENPSKIVSSFGGTLCLVLSFTYNTLMVALLAVPEVLRVTNHAYPLPLWLAPALAVLLSVALIVTPMFLASRRVKNLEI